MLLPHRLSGRKAEGVGPDPGGLPSLRAGEVQGGCGLRGIFGCGPAGDPRGHRKPESVPCGRDAVLCGTGKPGV